MSTAVPNEIKEMKRIIDNVVYDRDGIPTNLNFKLKVDSNSEFISCLKPNWDFSTYEYQIAIPDIITPLTQEDIFDRLKAGKSLVVIPKTTFALACDDGSIIFKDDFRGIITFYNWRYINRDGINYWSDDEQLQFDFYFDNEENMKDWQFIDGDPFYKIIPGVL